MALSSASGTPNPNWGGAFTAFGEKYAHYSSGYNGYFAGMLGIADEGTISDAYQATARLYHQAEGRWVSPDPAGLGAVDLTNPQSWNRYAYVLNDPLDYVDPEGLFVHCEWGTDGDNNCLPDPDPGPPVYCQNCGSNNINVNLPSGGRGSKAPNKGCPANQRRFFANLPLYQGVAKQANTNVNFIMALSAQESGWNGPHSQELNNLFGTTHAGGRNLGYASYQASASAWANSYSSWVNGATTINQFVGDLLNHIPPYNVNAYGDYATSILGGTFKNPALNGASTIGTYRSVLNYASACGVNR